MVNELNDEMRWRGNVKKVLQVYWQVTGIYIRSVAKCLFRMATKILDVAIPCFGKKNCDDLLSQIKSGGTSLCETYANEKEAHLSIALNGEIFKEKRYIRYFGCSLWLEW